jgi:hypothetical protein
MAYGLNESGDHDASKSHSALYRQEAIALYNIPQAQTHDITIQTYFKSFSTPDQLVRLPSCSA